MMHRVYWRYLLVALPFALLVLCNRQKEIDATGFVRMMEMQPQDLDHLRRLLDSRSSVYKLSKERRLDVITDIKKDTTMYLKKMKDGGYGDTHFYPGKSGEDIEYVWLLASVSSDLGRNLTATSHDYFLVCFDSDFRIVGWKHDK